MSLRTLIPIFLAVVCLASSAGGETALSTRLDQADAISRQRNYAEALELYRAISGEAPPESTVQARAFLREGVMLRELGQIEPAMASLERARELYEKLQDPIGTATAWSELGLVHERAGKREEALAAQQRAIEAGGAALPAKERALIETRIGVLHRQRGDLPKAIEHYEKARRLAIEAKDVAGEARALTNLTVAYLSRGNFAEAERYGLRSLALTPPSADQSARARILSNLGVIAERQNQLALALERYREAAAIAEKAGQTQGIAILKGNLADVELRRGNPAAAVRYLEEALSVAEDASVAALKPALLLRLSQARREQGEHESALEHARAAVALARESKNRPDLADALLQVSETLRASGDSRQADKIAAEAADLAREIAHRDTAWRALTLRGQLAEGDAALRYFTEAVEVIEQMRERTAGGEMGRQRYFSDKLAPYHGIIRLKHRAGALEEALAWAEKSKARVIVDALAGSDAEPAARALEMDAGALGSALGNAGTLALQYVVMEDETLLFAVRPADGQLQVDAIPIKISAEKLAAKISFLRERLAARGRGFTAAARELFELLVAPALKKAEDRASLIVAPDASLLELPFAALIDGSGRYLLDKYNLRHVPSFSAFVKMRERLGSEPSADSVLLVAAPDTTGHDREWAPLPEAERLANSLRDIYGPQALDLLTGKEATPARFAAAAGRHDIIHAATHAVLDDSSPLFSRLILARPDDSSGVVTAADLMRLPLGESRLVILSACETARGQASSGEGMIGLSWALLLAGSPGCVVTHWKVESRSVAEMMAAFHAGLRRGSDAAAALRDAALKLRRQPKTAHPFYWAPFVMLGAG